MTKVEFSMKLLLLLFILSLNTSIKAAPETQKIDEQEKEAVITKISTLMNEKYVYQKLAKKSTEYIKAKFSSGSYTKLDKLDEFIEKIVDDLRATSGDKQIRIQLLNHKNNLLNKGDPEIKQILQRNKEKSQNYGFKEVKIMDGNVGYLNFNYFSGHDSATDTAAAMMKFLSNVDALIIDLRDNVGGSSEMIQFMLSYFFKEKTLLNQTTKRGSDVQQRFWTLEDSPGKKMDKIPIFILISGKTYSAAEAFSYYIKANERAILVGEVTPGFANGVNTFRINDSLKIFIPTRLTASPITKTNWAKTGVIPHIKVPADTAFDKAYELARLEAEKYGGIRSDRKIKAIKDSVLSFQE